MRLNRLMDAVEGEDVARQVNRNRELTRILGDWIAKYSRLLASIRRLLCKSLIFMIFLDFSRGSGVHRRFGSTSRYSRNSLCKSLISTIVSDIFRFLVLCSGVPTHQNCLMFFAIPGQIFAC